MAKPIENSVQQNPTEASGNNCEKDDHHDDDDDDDGANINDQPPSKASFSMAHALSMLRNRQEAQKAAEKDNEEDKKEKTKAKRKRRRHNQKLARAKARAQVSTDEGTSPSTNVLPGDSNNRPVESSHQSGPEGGNLEASETATGEPKRKRRRHNQKLAKAKAGVQVSTAPSTNVLPGDSNNKPVESSHQSGPEGGNLEASETATGEAKSIPDQTESKQSNITPGLKRARDEDEDQAPQKPKSKRKRRHRPKASGQNQGSNVEDHNSKRTDDGAGLDQSQPQAPPVGKPNMFIPRALMVKATSSESAIK